MNRRKCLRMTGFSLSGDDESLLYSWFAEDYEASGFLCQAAERQKADEVLMASAWGSAGMPEMGAGASGIVAGARTSRCAGAPILVVRVGHRREDFRRAMRTVSAIHPAHRDDIADLVTRRPLPGPGLAQVDPFLFLNHHGPQAYPPGNRGLPFGPHPHRGFETVTFILEGTLAHYES